MAVRNYALGTLNPVVYFINSSGTIALPPSTGYAQMVKENMRRKGFELREASTLAEIDQLQKHMIQQEYAANQRRMEVEEAMGSRIRSSIRDRLYARMVSGSTGAYEKEFIRNYLQVREDRREKHRSRFACDQMFFAAREYDGGGKNHLTDTVSRVPEMKDETCTRCGQRRVLKGSKFCAVCA